MTDFFISYNKDDVDWAQWIAWQIEEAGYTTIVQAWDFPPGSDFVNSMNRAIKQSTRVLPILSASYIESEHANSEWRDHQRRDPSASKSLIVPIRVRSCRIEGLLGPRVYIDLLGISDAQEAKRKLVDEISKLPKLPEAPAETGKDLPTGNRSKPECSPRFPGAPASSPSTSPRRIDYSHLKFLSVLEGAEDELYSIAFSPDGRWVAAGSNGTVLLWDISSLGQPKVIDGHGSYVYSVAFSCDSHRLVSGCEDGFVRVWDIPKGYFVWQVQRHKEAVYSVAFSPDGSRVASGGYDKLVNLWEAERGQFMRSSETDFRVGVGRVTSVAFSPDGRNLAVGSLDDTVRLWDIVAGSARVLGEHDSSVEGLAFSPDGKLLASCGLDKAVRVWDPINLKKPLKWVQKKHEYLVRSVAFSPDSKTIASVGWDKRLNLWNSDNGELILTMPFDTTPGHWHSDWIWSVAFSPVGMQLLASSGSDQKIIVWQVASTQADNS